MIGSLSMWRGLHVVQLTWFIFVSWEMHEGVHKRVLQQLWSPVIFSPFIGWAVWSRLTIFWDLFYVLHHFFFRHALSFGHLPAKLSTLICILQNWCILVRNKVNLVLWYHFLTRLHRHSHRPRFVHLSIYKWLLLLPLFLERLLSKICIGHVLVWHNAMTTISHHSLRIILIHARIRYPVLISN